MLTLYNNAYSTCSQKVRLCLAEKGVDWTDRQINFRNNEHLAPDYLKLNPNGVVPTLVHDDAVVIDSSVIMEYLDEVFPEPAMAPRNAAGRADLRAWLRYFEEVATPAVRYPSFNQAFVRHYATLDDATFEGAAARRPLRKHFYRRMGKSGFGPAEQRNALEGFAQTAARMETRLEGRLWLMGDYVSIADCCVAPLYDRMDDLGHAYLWGEQPRVQDWLRRFRARPAWSTTYYAGTRLSALYADLGDRKTELKDLVEC